jgi:hypothetical protein
MPWAYLILPSRRRIPGRDRRSRYRDKPRPRFQKAWPAEASVEADGPGSCGIGRRAGSRSTSATRGSRRSPT